MQTAWVVRSKSLNPLAPGNVGFAAQRPHFAGQDATVTNDDFSRRPGDNAAPYLFAASLVQRFVAGAQVRRCAESRACDVSQRERAIALRQSPSANQVPAGRVKFALNAEHRERLRDAHS